MKDIPASANAFDDSAIYLASPDAMEAIARDPYWPKWDTPWWHMLALWECGRADMIPDATALAMARAVNTHYLPFFPFTLEEIPAGKDPRRHVACHCELGTMFQVFTACGVDTEKEIPWLRPWFLKYQLEDGGLNCDEAHYAKLHGRSSIVSTLPCLEAILRAAKKPLSAEEIAFLDRGAEYLMKRRLCRRISNGELMDPSFTQFIFPRFYAYDILRGLSFLADWAAFRSVEIPRETVADAMQLVAEVVAKDGFRISRNFAAHNTSYMPQAEGSWDTGPASAFPLLTILGASFDPAGVLSREWERVQEAFSSPKGEKKI